MPLDLLCLEFATPNAIVSRENLSSRKTSLPH